MLSRNGTPITAKMTEDGVVRINIPGLSSKEKLRSLEVGTAAGTVKLYAAGLDHSVSEGSVAHSV